MTNKITYIKPKTKKQDRAMFAQESNMEVWLGDLETLMGYVTDYDSKIMENGSVECSVTITSKNDALMATNSFRLKLTQLSFCIMFFVRLFLTDTSCCSLETFCIESSFNSD